MNLIGYVRVSTAIQVEEGLGLEVQEEAIRAWCKANGHHLVAIHRDEGISGAKDVAGRPGLASALAAVEDLGEGLVMAKLDRLARALTVQEAVLAQVWRHGASVFALDVGEILRDDPDDPMRTAMRQMVGVFAQLERAMIAARMRAGRKLKASRGGYAHGAPRFGSRAEERELVVDAGEQLVITRATQLRAEGRSLRYIAATLNIEGLRPKRAERWHPYTLARILDRAGAGVEGDAETG